MKKILKKNLPNHSATDRFVHQLWNEHLKNEPAWTLFFEGGLGAGKTYAAKKIMELMGVKSAITSPTYSFVQKYDSDYGPIAHFDCYRLENNEDFWARGFEDLSGDKTIYKIVEWPEKLSPEARNSFSGEPLVVKFSFGIGVGMREVSLLKYQ